MVKKIKRNRGSIAIFLILCIASFLRLYKITTLIPFIGDQGWFFLSARDIILTGDVPLVGITSSHTWLHQGALWTYILAGALWFGEFHPLSGVFLTAIIGVVTTYLMYAFGKKIFSARVGLIAALLYATSPLIIIHSRMSYHTSPIPLFTLLLIYAMDKWIKGNVIYFPVVIFLFAILYNFELAIFTLVPILVFILLFGFVKKKTFVTGLFDKRIIFLTVIAFFVPMIPMILYDVGHGFPQTLKFLVWVGYKIAVTLRLYAPLHPDAPGETLQTMLTFITVIIQRFLFLPNAIIAVSMLLLSIFYIFVRVVEMARTMKYSTSEVLLVLFFLIPAVGYASAKTNSEGYVLILFPIVMYMIALFVSRLMVKRIAVASLSLLVITIALFNSYYFVKQDFLMHKYGYGPTLADRKNAAKRIILESANRPYILQGRGPESRFESFTDSYEYLTWWLGKPPSTSKQAQVFIIQEYPDKIEVERKGIQR